jgi:FkbM family methyltransferase
MRARRFLRVFSHLQRVSEVFRCVRECRGWARIIPGYLGLGSPAFPYRFETRNGECLILDTFEDLVTAWIIFIRNDYAVEAGCRTIVDAGANIGAFTLFAARCAPKARIVALEPFPSTFERLRNHVEQCPYRDRITCRALALCGHSGPRRMDDSPMASQFRGVLSPDAASTGVEVESVTLARLLELEQFEQVDLLKLDIEGSEYEILESSPLSVLRRVRAVAMEYHPNGLKSSLFQRLNEAGFELVHDDPSPTTGYGLAYFRSRPSWNGDFR